MYDDDFQSPHQTPKRDHKNGRNSLINSDIKNLLHKDFITKSPWNGSIESSIKTKKEAPKK